MAEVLPFPWNTFRLLQVATDSRVINAWTNGREEALTVLAEDLAAGRVPPDAETMERRYWSLSANRASKYRHRRQLEKQAADALRSQPRERDHSDELAVRELVALASSQLSPDDWVLLQEIGDGKSYREVAPKFGEKVGTLRSRVSRRRCHMRNSQVGSMILQVLQVARGCPA